MVEFEIHSYFIMCVYAYDLLYQLALFITTFLLDNSFLPLELELDSDLNLSMLSKSIIDSIWPYL